MKKGTTHTDLLIHSADQLAVIPAHDGGPQRGSDLGDLALIDDGAIAALHGRIVAVGPTGEVREAYSAETVIDARGHVVTPGFVDPHTHVLWAGDRADEFEMRVGGASYMEIMAAGGGIASTVKATRAASTDQLVAETLPRLDRMLALGSTTVEVKTGYGLDKSSEIKALDAILCLDAWLTDKSQGSGSSNKSAKRIYYPEHHIQENRNGKPASTL